MRHLHCQGSTAIEEITAHHHAYKYKINQCMFIVSYFKFVLIFQHISYDVRGGVSLFSLDSHAPIKVQGVI